MLCVYCGNSLDPSVIAQATAAISELVCFHCGGHYPPEIVEWLDQVAGMTGGSVPAIPSGGPTVLASPPSTKLLYARHMHSGPARFILTLVRLSLSGQSILGKMTGGQVAGGLPYIPVHRKEVFDTLGLKRGELGDYNYGRVWHLMRQVKGQEFKNFCAAFKIDPNKQIVPGKKPSVTGFWIPRSRGILFVGQHSEVPLRIVYRKVRKPEGYWGPWTSITAALGIAFNYNTLMYGWSPNSSLLTSLASKHPLVRDKAVYLPPAANVIAAIKQNMPLIYNEGPPS
jgi:hypothetical protein